MVSYNHIILGKSNPGSYQEHIGMLYAPDSIRVVCAEYITDMPNGNVIAVSASLVYVIWLTSGMVEVLKVIINLWML